MLSLHSRANCLKITYSVFMFRMARLDIITSQKDFLNDLNEISNMQMKKVKIGAHAYIHVQLFTWNGSSKLNCHFVHILNISGNYRLPN